MAWPPMSLREPAPGSELAQRLDDAICRFIREPNAEVNVYAFLAAAGLVVSTDDELREFESGWIYKDAARAIESGRRNDLATMQAMEARVATAALQRSASAQESRELREQARWQERLARDSTPVRTPPRWAVAATPTPPPPLEPPKPPPLALATKRAYSSEDA